MKKDIIEKIEQESNGYAERMMCEVAERMCEDLELFSYQEVEELFIDRCYWMMCGEGLADCVFSAFSEEEQQMIADFDGFDYYVQCAVEKYFEKHNDEWIEGLRKDYINCTARSIINDKRFKTEIDGKKNKPDFDLLYEVENSIVRTVGEGSEGMVRSWLNQNSAEVKQIFAGC